VHVDDLASAFVAAIEGAPAGTAWTVASHSVVGADRADAISAAAVDGSASTSVGWREALDELGPFLAGTLAMDMRVWTVELRRTLGWRPTAPDLLSALLGKTT